MDARATIVNGRFDTITPYLDHHRERSGRTIVRMQDDIAARFADRRLDVVQKLGVERQRLADPDQRATNERQTLGPAFQLESHCRGAVIHIPVMSPSRRTTHPNRLMVLVSL